MNIDNTEIRRLANGSIDTDYYLRHCHQIRSQSAHRCIRLSFSYPRKLIQKIFLRWINNSRLLDYLT